MTCDLNFIAKGERLLKVTESLTLEKL